MAHTGHLRNAEHLLRELLRRGHCVVLAFDRVDPEAPAARLLESLVAFGAATATVPPRSRSAVVGAALRSVLDYARYYDRPLAGQSDAYRDRAGSRVPRPLRAALGRTTLRRSIVSAVRAADRRAQAAPGGVAPVLDLLHPDVLVVTPLVELGSPQSEHLRAAKQRGIATALLVASWDNLTVKGGIHELPDQLLVWNEIQAREAVDLHGAPSERVAIVGATPFDHLFDGSLPARADVCAAAGLDAARPYVLYLASSSFIAPDERMFVAEWAHMVMSAGETAGLQVLVRPHPTNLVDATALPPGAVVYPPGGEDPVDDDARARYAGMLAHAAAVVGVNTSGLIEAAILGRPVLSVLDRRFASTQEKAMHFSYLIPANGGMLRLAQSLPEHVGQLAAAVADPGPLGALDASFVATFVRPNGVDCATAPIAAAALEWLAERGPANDPAKAHGAAFVVARPVRSAVGALVAVRAMRSRVRRRPLSRGRTAA
jgi:hypothetical protein